MWKIWEIDSEKALASLDKIVLIRTRLIGPNVKASF